MPDAPESRISLRSDDIVARSFADETVMLDLRSSIYLSTNPAGTVLWRELEQGTTRSQMVHALLEEFDVSPERAAADVDGFLAECRKRGLLAD